MPFIDTSQLKVKEPLPGWQGRFFNSESMTFGYYNIETGASIHEHSHPNEEVWHVIEGKLEVSIGGKTQVAGPGCVAVVPPLALRTSADRRPSDSRRLSAAAIHRRSQHRVTDSSHS